MLDLTGEDSASHTVRASAILLLLSGCLFLPGLGDRELWSPDEPRFGLVVQEMVRGGDFVVPHLEGKVHPEKPPLYFWLASLASLAGGGVSEASLRLPSALAAIGSVLVTFLLGRRLLGARAGWIGAIVLLTAGHFLMRGRWACTDMVMSFFFLISMALLAAALRLGRGGGIDRPAGRLFFVSAALATLAKGPVGLVLPVAILGAFLIAERRWGDLRRFPWATGMGIFLLVAGPWYALYGLRAGWETLETILFRENVNRYIQAWNNLQPFHYYVHRFPLSFLPWSVIFPAAAVSLARRWRSESGGSLRFLAFWFAIVFLFFSASSGKRTVYLLPLFPVAALIVGWFLDRGWEALGDSRSAWVRGTALALALFCVIAALAVPALAASRFHEALFPAIGLGTILGAASVLVAVQGWRGRVLHLPVIVAGCMILMAVVVQTTLIPRLEGYHNVRRLSARIAQAVPPDSRFATPRLKREAVLFYTGLAGEEIDDAGDLDRILAAPGPAYCLVEAADWERRSLADHPAGTVLLRASASEHDFVLVSNVLERAP
jgi:4-amino-4-deoxy-L-arabinose transferase-like glycosyltransferase